jgi:hypothetical protein
MGNRKRGNVWMVYILSELYDEWPRRLDLSAEMIRDATGQHVDEEEEFFDDLSSWLDNEGHV